MKTEGNVTALINAFKNQPNLWNKNCFRLKGKRQEYLEQIAQELKSQINVDVTWVQAGFLVSYLCQKYREDLKEIKAAKEDSLNNFTPSWYFQELHFLKSRVENNYIAQLNAELPDLLPHEILQMLDIYKAHSFLWNTNIIEHYCTNKKAEAMNEMLQTISTKININISEAILEEYLRTVHDCFSKLKRKKLNILSKRNYNFVIEQNKEDYYEHMMFLYDHVGPFKCSECGQETKGALSYKIHKSQHNGSAPLICSVCNKEFTSPTTYTNHARRHMEDTKHECKECGKKFYGSRELNIHMRDHTGAKPFCCEICGASFRHVQGFTNHHRRHEKNYLHTCHICSKGYYTMDRYKDHMNSHTNTRTHICSVCGKAFINKKGLLQHSVIHEDIRKFACKLCGKTFKHKTGVNQHMRTHGIPKREEHTVNKGLDII